MIASADAALELKSRWVLMLLVVGARLKACLHHIDPVAHKIAEQKLLRQSGHPALLIAETALQLLVHFLAGLLEHFLRPLFVALYGQSHGTGRRLPLPVLIDITQDDMIISVFFSQMSCYVLFSLIDKQITDENSPEVSLVSFENECILSVYDDRGCDIVFSTYGKMREFYPLLEPFFLKYDCETMEKRFKQEN